VDHLDLWIRETFPTLQNLTPTSEKKLLYKSTIGRWSVDCADRRYRVLQGIYYSATGLVVHSYEQTEQESTWSTVIPESVGEAVVDSVCAADRLYDGSYTKELAAYEARWKFIDSAAVLECRAGGRPEIVAPCKRLIAIKGQTVKEQDERWRLVSAIDSDLVNDWPLMPAKRSQRH
jgi:hypothetical protein